MPKSNFTEPYRYLCQLLLEGRERAGITQSELARCLGRSQSFVCKYERRERRLDVVELLRIAHCLKLDPSVILQAVSHRMTSPTIHNSQFDGVV